MGTFREELEKAFSPQQPRDKSGKWASITTQVGRTGKSTEFRPGSKSQPKEIGGVELKSWKPPAGTKTDPNAGWRKIADVPSADPAPLVQRPGKGAASGVIIHEPDGRVWLTKPTNSYGGYKYTFPKGSAEHDLTLQQNAVKEAYEETGLHVQITGHAGDYERDTSVGRYYHAKRIGGHPGDAGWESEGVTLAHPDDMHSLLNKRVDQKIAHEHAGAAKPPKPTPTHSESETWWNNFKKEDGPMQPITFRQALAATAADISKGFNPDQKRDASGKWTSEGGGFKAQHSLGGYKQDHPQVQSAHKFLGHLENIVNNPVMSHEEKLTALGQLKVPKGANLYQKAKVDGFNQALKHLEQHGSAGSASEKPSTAESKPDTHEQANAKFGAIGNSEKDIKAANSMASAWNSMSPSNVYRTFARHIEGASPEVAAYLKSVKGIMASKISPARAKKEELSAAYSIPGAKNKPTLDQVNAAIAEWQEDEKKFHALPADERMEQMRKLLPAHMVKAMDSASPEKIAETKYMTAPGIYGEYANKYLDALKDKHATAQTEASGDGMPDTSKWKKLEGQKGSNPGGVYQDETGQKWYVKHSQDDDTAKSEVLASKLYDAMGVQNLHPELVKTEKGLGVATKWNDGVTTVQQHGGVGKLTPQQKASAQSNFAAHALVGNWDAAGQGHDNQGFDKNKPGEAVTLDGGGSLEYRAQGGKKGKAWNGKADEWDSLRDKSVNAYSHDLFGSMTADQLKDSAKKMGKLSDEDIKSLVSEHGPGDDDHKAQLAKTLIDRKNAILAKADALKAPEPKAEPKPEPSAEPEAGKTEPATTPTAKDVLALHDKAKAAGKNLGILGMMASGMTGKNPQAIYNYHAVAHSQDNLSPETVAYVDAAKSYIKGHMTPAEQALAEAQTKTLNGGGHAEVKAAKSALMKEQNAFKKLPADQKLSELEKYLPPAFVSSMKSASPGVIDSLGENDIQAKGVLKKKAVSYLNAMKDKVSQAKAAEESAASGPSIPPMSKATAKAMAALEKHNPDSADMMSKAYHSGDMDTLKEYAHPGMKFAMESFAEAAHKQLSEAGIKPKPVATGLPYDEAKKQVMSFPAKSEIANIYDHYHSSGDLTSLLKLNEADGSHPAIKEQLNSAVQDLKGKMEPEQVAYHEAAAAMKSHQIKAGDKSTVSNYAKGIISPQSKAQVQEWASKANSPYPAHAELGKAAQAALDLQQAKHDKAVKAKTEAAQAAAPVKPDTKSLTPAALPEKLHESKLTSKTNSSKSLLEKNDKIHQIGQDYAAGKLSAKDATDQISNIQGDLGSKQYYHQKLKQHADTVKAAIQSHAAAGAAAAPIETAPKTPDPLPPKKVTPIEPATPKFNHDLVPKPPTFTASSKAHVNQANTDAAKAIHEAAKTGDVSQIENAQVPKVNKETGESEGTMAAKDSPAKSVKDYLSQVTDNVTRQLNPPAPPEPWKNEYGFESMHLIGQHFPTIKGGKVAQNGADYFRATKLGSVGAGVTHKDLGIDPSHKQTLQGANKNIDLNHWEAGAITKFSQMKKDDPDQKAAVASYTGSGHHGINDSFIKGKPTEKAKLADAAIHKYGETLPKGMVLSRRVQMKPDELKKMLSGSGDVLQDHAIMSTSLSPDVFNSPSNNVHFKLTVGDGVKGLYAGKQSTISGEKEMLLPANTRMVIHKVTKTHGKKDSDEFGGSYATHVIHATILPTDQGTTK